MAHRRCGRRVNDFLDHARGFEMRVVAYAAVLSAALGAHVLAQATDPVRQFVSVDAPVVALTHVRVIDGTGAPARANQVVVIERGVIRAAGDSASVAIPADAKVMDMTG